MLNAKKFLKMDRKLLNSDNEAKLVRYELNRSKVVKGGPNGKKPH